MAYIKDFSESHTQDREKSIKIDHSVNKIVFPEDKPFYEDMVTVRFISGLGCSLGVISIPKTMEKGLISNYFNSGSVKSTYLYINGVEISDNKNHNPFYVGAYNG